MFCLKNTKTSSQNKIDRKKNSKKKKTKKKKKIENKKLIIFLEKKNFARKKISQNIFWINWGSGEHEEKFLEVERQKKR